MDLKYTHNRGLKPKEMKKGHHKFMKQICEPYITTFNEFIDHGLNDCAVNTVPVYASTKRGDKIVVSVTKAELTKPLPADGYSTGAILPSECRMARTSYSGKLFVQFNVKVNGNSIGNVKRELARLPIMVQSKLCNLSSFTPLKLTQNKEDENEPGGYFIVNGNEKLIRMLILPRSNYPMTVIRPSWKSRGAQYTHFGLALRCVEHDQTAATHFLHYMVGGSYVLCVFYQQRQFFLPLFKILRGLTDMSDQQLYALMIYGMKSSDSYTKSIMNMMKTMRGISKLSVLEEIGKSFRVQLAVLPEWFSDVDVGSFFFDNVLLPQLKGRPLEKLHMLAYMTQKLFYFVSGKCEVENADSTSFQEVLMCGHLYQMYVKDKIESYLELLRITLQKQISATSTINMNISILEKAIDAMPRNMIGRDIENMLATGNINSKTGLALMQKSGLCIIAERLNYFRFCSHYASVHRGAFFMDSRIDSVRDLVPDAWGFICSVHTPDGGPCGLLCHLCHGCRLTAKPVDERSIIRRLIEFGMLTVQDAMSVAVLPTSQRGTANDFPAFQQLPVTLNGRWVGVLDAGVAPHVADELRHLKLTEDIDKSTEICLVEYDGFAGQYPGLYLFSGLCRFTRPVWNVVARQKEIIGSFEQVYLNIAAHPNEFREWCRNNAKLPASECPWTHCELTPFAQLSSLASLTPYSDFNQSPRNIYQCQMAKQTMGTPTHTLQYRADNKMYRLMSPQVPCSKTRVYDDMDVDSFPAGTNAIVAVISYTGYDMEDGMTVNRASLERGFGHASIYKTLNIDLRGKGKFSRGQVAQRLGNAPRASEKIASLDSDGLPYVGALLTNNSPMYGIVHVETGAFSIEKYKSLEDAIVDKVLLVRDERSPLPLQAAITLRIKRNAQIGDKFASRHGQKGICSLMTRTEDMPFTASGMVPDIIFNPNSIPSRMTVGKLIETMAGKTASMHGECHDCAPFIFDEDRRGADFFADRLMECGYNYRGKEVMYSGVTGEEMETMIFIGVVHYQRLRHLVADKYQVRGDKGPIDQLTRQPVGGRKVGGGVRLGEMERDVLIGYGAQKILDNRMFFSSDADIQRVCERCGSTTWLVSRARGGDVGRPSSIATQCLECDKQTAGDDASAPFVSEALPVNFASVTKYFGMELACLDVDTKLHLHDNRDDAG